MAIAAASRSGFLPAPRNMPYKIGAELDIGEAQTAQIKATETQVKHMSRQALQSFGGRTCPGPAIENQKVTDS